MKLTSMRHDLSQKSAEVRQIYAQRDERVKEIADLECTISELEDQQDESSQSRERLSRDLDTIEREIATKEKELRDLLPRLSASKANEAKLKQRYPLLKKLN